MRKHWAVASFCACVAAHAATLARYPYLENVREDRATVIWTTLENGRGRVEHSIDGATWRRTDARATLFPVERTGMSYGYTQYEAEITGLRASTEYWYRVRVNDEIMSSAPDVEARFRTAGPGAFRFLVVGDSGTGSEAQLQVARRMSMERPAFMLHTGDIVYPVGAFVHYQSFYFDPYAALLARAPFFPTLGNHDYETAQAAPYLALHALPASGVPEQDRGRYYSFDWGNAHFVCLDTNTPLDAAIRGDGGMLDWLDRDLAATRQFWRIVYFHHPVYSTGIYERHRITLAVREHIAPVLERHRVHLVLHGHEHSYQRSRPIRGGEPAPDGTVYVTTGGGGAGLYDATLNTRLAFVASQHHYVRVDVNGPRLDVEAVDTMGNIIDYSLVAPAPRLSSPAATNAASFTTELAPGSLVSIFGRDLASEAREAARIPLPVDLGGVQVLLNGRAIPLQYVSPTQVNAQLPFDAEGSPALRVVTQNGAVETRIRVVDAAPAVFALATGEALITHSGGVLVTSELPARPGERLSIYLTGLGRVEGAISAGQAAPSRPPMAARVPVEIEVGGTRVRPLFVRLAPGFVGLYQIDFDAPDLTGPHPMRVIARSAESNRVTLHLARDSTPSRRAPSRAHATRASGGGKRPVKNWR